MIATNELRIDRNILDHIDWEMTPERAIETYMEWGSGWARKNDFVRYADQESLYFVIYDWEDPLQVTLVRRTTQDLTEVAQVAAPIELIQDAIYESGRKPGVGVHAINEPLKAWLKQELNAGW